MVGRFDPFHCTVEPFTKFVPLTVIVRPEPPIGVELGASVVTVGAAGAEIAKLADDCPPPGVGFVTITLAVPAACRSLAETGRLSWLLLSSVAVLGVPFQVTDELEMNPDPLIANVNPLEPAAIDAGESDFTAGAGLLDGFALEPPPHATRERQTKIATKVLPSPTVRIIG